MAEKTAETPPKAEEPKSASAGSPEANASGAKPAEAGAAAADGEKKASKAEVAKEKAKEAAKQAAAKGLEVFQKLRKGAGGQVKQILLSAIKAPLEIVKGDASTRYLALGLLSSILVVGYAGHQLFRRAVPARVESSDPKTAVGQNLGTFFEQQKELAIASARVVTLEQFVTTIRSRKGVRVQGVQIEIFAETESPEASRFVDARKAEVREVVNLSLQGQVYEELITDQGKKALRDRIRSAINERFGKVFHGDLIRQIYFGKFVMG